MKYLLIILLFTGCYSAKKAQQQVDKADSHYPEIVAKLARDKYPCTDLLKPDTTIIYEDSIILVEIECPDQPTEVIRYDTVNNVITRTVRVPVNMPVQIRTVTKWYEDSAKLKILNLEATACQQAVKKLQATNDKQAVKIARKSKENWIWRIIAIILAAWTVFRFWNKITTFKVKSV